VADIVNIPSNTIKISDRKIYWLASYPKSGNTWVRMFLNAYLTGGPLNINSGHQYICSDIRPDIFQMMMPRSLTEITIDEQFMYHQGALLNLIKLAATKDILVKTHNAKAIVSGTALIPPKITGGAIYIIRDPRDIVVSYSKHFAKTIDESIDDINDENRAGMGPFNLCHLFMSWSKNVSSWTYENQNVDVLAIKYETLIKQTKQSFIEILKYLELPIDTKRLDHAIFESTFVNLKSKETEFGFVEKANNDNFFRSGKYGQWKKVLNKAQIDKIEGANKEIMRKYGYL